MQLPPFVTQILKTLETAGFRAYCVGGCVRDLLLGRPCKDYDVTTDARPEAVRAVFAPRRVLDTGLAHGTVTLLTPQGPVEITTFRGEGDYSDHRHPGTVHFCDSLSEDLARRDFTVNAMALDRRGTLFDPFGGRTDLARGVLRCVGSPDERFSEDALRILRALRFSAVLGFSLAPDTAAAVQRLSPLLRHLSRERVWSELSRLLCGKNAAAVLKNFAQTLAPLLCLETPALRAGAQTLDLVPPELSLRLAHLFFKSGVSCPRAREILTSLRAERRRCDAVCAYLNALPLPVCQNRIEVRRLICRLGAPVLRGALTLSRAAPCGDADALDFLAQTADDIARRGECCSPRQLAVRGRDLAALGLSGPEIGKTLSALLDAVLDDRLPNDRAALLSAALSR